MRILYNPHEPLKNDETILLRRGALYTESLNARARRFTLINLFTNHRYNKTTVITRLIFKARWADEQLAEKYINAADTLLARAKAEAPSLSKYRFVRWIKGTPLVNIADLEQRIANARNNRLDPEPQNELKPKKPALQKLTLVEARQRARDSLTLSKHETIAIMRRALQKCSAYDAHYKVLKKWILVAENQENLIADYDRERIRTGGKGFLYLDRKSYLYFHGEVPGQDPATQLYKGLEAYATIFERVESNEGHLKSFFKGTLSDKYACFDGSYRDLLGWHDRLINPSADLVLNIEPEKDKFQNIGELNRVFDAIVFRNYFQQEQHEHYAEYDDTHRAIREQYFDVGRRTAYMEHYRNVNASKNNFVKFIRDENYLPLQFSDILLTEENLKAEVDEYFMVCFGE